MGLEGASAAEKPKTVNLSVAEHSWREKLKRIESALQPPSVSVNKLIWK